jgi:hypothetical protein
MRIFFLIIVAFFLQHLCLASQIKGYIVDPVNQDTLAGVHIYNQSRDLGGLSNEDGFFQISAQLGDTIHFFHKGNHPKLIIVRKHHYWTSLLIYLERRTILLNGYAQKEERQRMIAKKYRTPMLIAGLPSKAPSDKNSDRDRESEHLFNKSPVFSNLKLQNEVKEAYSLTDKQLEDILLAFHQQQKSILNYRNDRDVISFFLQFVEAQVVQVGAH